MAETWPPQLNFMLDRGSFSIEEKDLTRTDFEDGPQLVRVRFSNPTTTYNGTITITNEEFLILRGFYRNILNQGARWFEIPLWDGNSYAINKARFLEPYTVKDEGYNQYTLGIKLEVREYPTYDSFTSYLIGLYGTDFVINEMCDPLQIIVNITYPHVVNYVINTLPTGMDYLVDNLGNQLSVTVGGNLYVPVNDNSVTTSSGEILITSSGEVILGSN